MRTFRLFPEGRHFWSLEDYGAVIDVMERLRPRTVLEFGPGSSTLALIEGGAESIDCCEDDPDWEQVYRLRLEMAYPEVTIHAYDWQARITIPALDDKRYDLALIDGPHGSPRRAAAIEYALQRCAAVLVPTEEWRDGRLQPELGLRAVIAELATTYGRSVEIMETGPLSGAFALIT